MPVTDLLAQGWARVASGIDPSRLRALPIDAWLPEGEAGSRNLLEAPWCAEIAAALRLRLQAMALLPEDTVAIQCTLFRKSEDCNWKVPYHQDLSVPVAGRAEHPDWSGWSVKEDGHYAQPPEALLDALLAVRLHLDACPADAGALRVVPGSHRDGRLSPAWIAAMAKRAREVVCVADAGELLLMRPLLLHASSKADRPNGRRVLHFLFAPPMPDGDLRWRIAV